MGQFLRTRWGKAYLNVGFAFDHGDFRSGDRQDNDRVHPFTVGPLPPGSFDATLNATGLPRFILDLRTPPAGIVTDWLSAQHAKREITEAFNPKWPSAISGLPGVTAREFDLLRLLAEHPRQVFSREQLFERLWDSYGDQHTVTVHIGRLRDKLERDPGHPGRSARAHAHGRDHLVPGDRSAAQGTLAAAGGQHREGARRAGAGPGRLRRGAHRHRPQRDLLRADGAGWAARASSPGSR